MTVVTPSILKLIRRSFKLGQPFSFHPYEWDEERSLPCWTKSKGKLALWSLNVLLPVVHLVFVITRAVQVNLEGETGTSMRMIYMQFMTIYFTFPVLFQVTFLTQRGKLVRYVEAFSKFYKLFEGMIHSCSVLLFLLTTYQYCFPQVLFDELLISFVENFVLERARQPRIMKLCEFFMHGVYYTFVLNSVFVVLIPVFLPASPEQWTSLLPCANERSLVELAPFVVALAYYMYLYITNAFLIIFSVFVSMFGMLEIMKQCRYVLRAR